MSLLLDVCSLLFFHQCLLPQVFFVVVVDCHSCTHVPLLWLLLSIILLHISQLFHPQSWLPSSFWRTLLMVILSFLSPPPGLLLPVNHALIYNSSRTFVHAHSLIHVSAYHFVNCNSYISPPTELWLIVIHAHMYLILDLFLNVILALMPPSRMQPSPTVKQHMRSL